MPTSEIEVCIMNKLLVHACQIVFRQHVADQSLICWFYFEPNCHRLALASTIIERNSHCLPLLRLRTREVLNVLGNSGHFQYSPIECGTERTRTFILCGGAAHLGGKRKHEI